MLETDLKKNCFKRQNPIFELAINPGFTGNVTKLNGLNLKYSFYLFKKKKFHLNRGLILSYLSSK